jgi:hypothetical protein
MVGRTVLTQAGERGGERCRGACRTVGRGQAGAGQVAFGPQNRSDIPGLIGVEQGRQVVG